MIPRILCRSCATELDPADKFCSSCGATVEWPTTPPLHTTSRHGDPDVSASGIRTLVCTICGQENGPDTIACVSCGAILPGRSKRSQSSSEEKDKPAGGDAKPAPLSFLQSWKLTAALAVILAGVIVVSKMSRDSGGPETSGLSPRAAMIVRDIEQLQRNIDTNPADTASMLHLANLYQDVRMFPRAIQMYERYLKANPANPDARIDLATSYFELSFSDTASSFAYIQTAKEEITKALEQAPKHQLGHFNLGIINFRAGSAAEAMEWFRKCIAIDPNSEIGRRAQQFVNQHSTINPS